MCRVKRAETTGLHCSGADYELRGDPSSHRHHLWSVREEFQNPVAGGSLDHEVSQLTWSDGVKSRSIVK